MMKMTNLNFSDIETKDEPVRKHNNGVDFLVVGFLRGDERFLLFDGVFGRFQ